MAQRHLWGWSEPSPKLTPSQRLSNAITAYEDKFEMLPLFCFVHSSTIARLEGQQIGCAVYGAPGVPRTAYYFGLPGDVA